MRPPYKKKLLISLFLKNQVTDWNIIYNFFYNLIQNIIKKNYIQ